LKKILIAEDDADTMEIVETILNLSGYAVIKINREITLKEVAGINPDLAVLDYLLPHTLGSELCLQIKSHPETRHIPIILYSASNVSEKVRQESKADAYLHKPFDLEEFVKLVDKLAL
jgi:DNA-binding response OmpR family regulator